MSVADDVIPKKKGFADTIYELDFDEIAGKSNKSPSIAAINLAEGIRERTHLASA